MPLSLSPAPRPRASARRALALFAVALLAASPAAWAQGTAAPDAAGAPAASPAASAPSPTLPATTAPAPAAAVPTPLTPSAQAPGPTTQSPATPPASGTQSPPAAAALPAPRAAPEALAPQAASPSAATPPAALQTGAQPAPATEPANAAGTPVETDLAADERAGADETLPHDLSPWGMFMAADRVVKGVMLGLAFASLVTWTILVTKGLEILFAKSRARGGVRRLADAETIGDARRGRRWRGPVALLARAAEDERSRSSGLPADGVKERAAIALARVEAGAGRAIARGTGLLATIGSTAPFVGLFGTVWGIMNSFIGISQANTTNLAVVAPGIAEALLATAIGLVAAIPAVVFYNLFARSIAGYRAILSDGSALVLQHLSRQLDRQAAEADALRAGERHPRAAE